MSTIVFCVHPVIGSINTSLKLAKDLQSAGHRIIYIGCIDCAALMEPHGFDFLPVFENWFPKGWLKHDWHVHESVSFISKLMLIRDRLNHLRRFMEELGTSGYRVFARMIEDIKPNLLLIVGTHYDSFIWSLLAYRSGVPGVYLFNNFYSSMDASIPPITSSFIPTNTLMSRVRVFLEWQRHFLGRVFSNGVMTLGVNIYSSGFVRRIAKHLGYPSRHITIATDLLAPMLRMPVLITMPKALDFPGHSRPGRYYIENSVDPERAETSFPWNKVDGCKPLIYCSLGTMPYLSRKGYLKFYNIVVAVARMKPEWQWIIAVGDGLGERDLAPVPENVIIVARAPQLAILRRSRMVITHGGTNTLKECIVQGIPMVIFPLGFDQYGNAARAAYHGLAVRGDIKNNNTDYLQSLLSEIDRNSYYRIQTMLMRRRFLDSRTSENGCAMIETLLGGLHGTVDFRYLGRQNPVMAGE